MSLLRFRRNRPAVTSNDLDRHRAWRLEALRLDYPKAHATVGESDAASKPAGATR